VGRGKAQLRRGGQGACPTWVMAWQYAAAHED
jgi:hypothetical protein